MKAFFQISSRFFKEEEMKCWEYYKEPWDTLLTYSGYGVMGSSYESSKLRYVGYFNIALLFYYGISGLAFVVQNEWNLQLFSEITMITVVGAIIAVQMMTLIVHRYTLRDLVVEIEDDWAATSHPVERDMLVGRAKYGYYPMICLNLTIFFAALCFTVNAAFHHKTNGLPASFTILGIGSYDFPYYHLNFIYHTCSMMLAATCMTPFLGYLSNPVLQMLAQLEILAYRLRKIGVEIVNEDEMVEVMRHAHYKHLNIIDRAKRLTMMYEKFLFAQVFVSGSCISLAMFTLMSNDNLFEINTVSIFLGASTMHLFTVCWFGELLNEGSVAFSTELYASTWYLAPCSTQKDLAMMIKRAQTPICVSIGGVAQLRLETFTSVMKSAYSYCAVLASVNE